MFKKRVFSWRSKVAIHSTVLRHLGGELYVVGPEPLNPLSPSFVLVRGMIISEIHVLVGNCGPSDFLFLGADYK